jgi:hypothetical protein
MTFLNVLERIVPELGVAEQGLRIDVEQTKHCKVNSANLKKN